MTPLVSYASEALYWKPLLSMVSSRDFSNTVTRRRLSYFDQFFPTAQLSHPYIDIGNTVIWTSLHLVVRLMSLLFQMRSIALHPRDRCTVARWFQVYSLVISGVQSPVWSIIDPKKQNSLTHSMSSPLIVLLILPGLAVDMILVFLMFG